MACSGLGRQLPAFALSAQGRVLLGIGGSSPVQSGTLKSWAANVDTLLRHLLAGLIAESKVFNQRTDKSPTLKVERNGRRQRARRNIVGAAEGREEVV